MTKLTEIEQSQIRTAAERAPSRPPWGDRKSIAAYVEFATFASRFSPKDKPVRFVGANWKL